MRSSALSMSAPSIHPLWTGPGHVATEVGLDLERRCRGNRRARCAFAFSTIISIFSSNLDNGLVVFLCSCARSQWQRQ